MIYLTVDKIMAWGPCSNWPRERVASVFGKRKRLPLLDLLRNAEIVQADRIWLACHALPEREARLLACLWATQLLKASRAAGREPAEASWAVVRIARRFANGRATKEELTAAASAAWAGAGWRAAVWVTAASAAAGAVTVALWAVALWAVEGPMDRNRQLRDIIRVVKRLEKGGEA